MEWWLACAAMGALVGFLAGLLGVGGGAIAVPLLVRLFESQGVERSEVFRLAVGTAMATIVFTSISSFASHARRDSVRWELVVRFAPGIVAGGIAGALLATALPTRAFALGFTIVIYAAGTSILLDRRPRASTRLPGLAGLVAAGVVIGSVSSFAAIGGAFMTVPFLVWANVPLLAAIGTSAAVGFPIGVSATAGYVLSGIGQHDLPPHTLGFVYVPAAIGVSLGSVATAPIGAFVAHKMPVKWLKRVFALLLYAVATRTLVDLW